MDTCPNYDRLYNPFRADGTKAARRKLAVRNLILIETLGAADYGLTAAVTPMDAVIVQLSLTNCARSDLFVAGKRIDGVARGARSVLMHDLRRSRSPRFATPSMSFTFICLVECWRRWPRRSPVRRSTICRYSLRPQADKIQRLNTSSFPCFLRSKGIVTY